jgi:hypothetical protein
MLNKRNEAFQGGKLFWLGKFVPVVAALILFFSPAGSYAENRVMGEVQFEGVTKVERDSGVWIDGQYVGYLKELKGNKKVMLLPGEHEISVRQAGLDDFVRKIVVEPGQKQTVRVANAKKRGMGYAIGNFHIEADGATESSRRVSRWPIRRTRGRIWR